MIKRTQDPYHQLSDIPPERGNYNFRNNETVRQRFRDLKMWTVHSLFECILIIAQIYILQYKNIDGFITDKDL